ncbi:AP-3 complex subunit delta-1 [Thoreauomyces humboldtii]|nr:AP-3 complex subunit delta-1 [Thoreauomyces humboldtii]
MAWASFHVIEVMSSPKNEYKRIGYQAAAVSFRQDTDVLMLCTNLIKKDLSSNNHAETALALHGLAAIVTPDLGRDLTPDLMAMMNHSRPYIRKRVMLVLYRVFLKYPEALRLAFPRLKEKLDDSDPAVVSAVVNVICELARRNPKSYLPLAPQLYGLLTNSTNNWMLIKIIKLFAALTPLEPRLTKKLLPQITNLIQTTSAMSLLYECIHTVISGGMIGPEVEGGDNEAQDEALTKLCTSKLKIFIAEPDQNLKYLGLFALSKLLIVRPKAVIEHRDTILNCLDDADVSIRMRALDIVTGMVTPTNLTQIVRKLLTQVMPPEVEASPTASYPPPSLSPVLDASDRIQVINRIISICSRDTYANVTNFEWYISVLVGLVRTKGVDVGFNIAMQLVDIAVRVVEVRDVAVRAMLDLIADDNLLFSASQDVNNTSVLWAAAWIVGEFSGFAEDPVYLMERLVTRGVEALPPMVQGVYLQNLLKVFARWAVSEEVIAEDNEKFVEITNGVLGGLEKFKTSVDLEVQERAYEAFEILSMIPLDGHGSRQPIVTELAALFAGEMNPVGAKAQKRVPLPDGLDLDAWICEPEPEPVDAGSEGGYEDTEFWNAGQQSGQASGWDGGRSTPVDPEEAERRRQDRAEQKKYDPFYIPPSPGSRNKPLYDDIDVNEIPIVRLDFGEGGLPDGPIGTSSKLGKSKKTKRSGAKRAPSPPPIPVKSYVINRGAEMPDGHDESNESQSPDDPETHMDEITKAVMSVDLTRDHDDPIERSVVPDFFNPAFEVTRKKVSKPRIVEPAAETEPPKKPRKKKSKPVEPTDNAEGVADTPGKKKKKKKVTTPAAADTPPRAMEMEDAGNTGLLQVRGLDSSTPYERLSSPAPSAVDKTERRDLLIDLPDLSGGGDLPATPPVGLAQGPDGSAGSDAERDWIWVGGGDLASLSFDWERVTPNTTDHKFEDDAPAGQTIPINLYLKVASSGSETPYPVPTLTVAPRHSGAPRPRQVFGGIAIPASGGEVVERIRMRLPTLPAPLSVSNLLADLPPLELVVPVTARFALGSADTHGAGPALPSPDVFAALLASTPNLHTSSTQFRLTATNGAAPAAGAVVGAVARRVRMHVVERVDHAATLWSWIDDGDDVEDGNRRWCAALVRVNLVASPGPRAQAAAAVKVEVRATDAGLADAVCAEVAEWGLSGPPL